MIKKPSILERMFPFTPCPYAPTKWYISILGYLSTYLVVLTIMSLIPFVRNPFSSLPSFLILVVVTWAAVSTLCHLRVKAMSRRARFLNTLGLMATVPVWFTVVWAAHSLIMGLKRDHPALSHPLRLKSK